MSRVRISFAMFRRLSEPVPELAFAEAPTPRADPASAVRALPDLEPGAEVTRAWLDAFTPGWQVELCLSEIELDGWTDCDPPTRASSHQWFAEGELIFATPADLVLYRLRWGRGGDRARSA